MEDNNNHEQINNIPNLDRKNNEAEIPGNNRDVNLKMDNDEEAVPISYVTDLTTEEKIWGAISYINFLGIIPLLAKKDSAFCQFHSRQGVVLAVIIHVIKYISIVRLMIPYLYFLELLIVFFVVIQAYSGKWFKIPFIYNLSIKIKI